MRVLILHPTAAFGGASKSLIELLSAACQLDENAPDVVVLCPEGRSADDFRAAGLKVIPSRGLPKWDNTRYGFYRGLRWLILIREFVYLIPGAVRLLVLTRENRFDLVHSNEITLLPFAVLAKRMLRCPLVVHVRSLQRGLAGDARTRWINGMLRRHAAAVIAIDQTVRRTLPQEQPVTIIHNVISAPSPTSSPLAHRGVRVGIVGSLLRLKGVYEFVEAARICRDRELEAEFLIVGENPRDLSGIVGWLLARFDLARDARGELEALVRRYALASHVRFAGFVKDVHSVYAQLDILCFPSHLDAAGRPVFEAALHGVPSIVAARDPAPDTIVHGETGLCIPQPDPSGIADAIERLATDHELRRRLGEGARRLATLNFDAHENARKLLDVYRQAVRGTPAT